MKVQDWFPFACILRPLWPLEILSGTSHSRMWGRGPGLARYLDEKVHLSSVPYSFKTYLTSALRKTPWLIPHGFTSDHPCIHSHPIQHLICSPSMLQFGYSSASRHLWSLGMESPDSKSRHLDWCGHGCGPDICVFNTFHGIPPLSKGKAPTAVCAAH